MKKSIGFIFATAIILSTLTFNTDSNDNHDVVNQRVPEPWSVGTELANQRVPEPWSVGTQVANQRVPEPWSVGTQVANQRVPEPWSVQPTLKA